MTTEKTYTWTPTTETGFLNDELDNIWAEIVGAGSVYAPIVHTHVEADITDLGTYATAAEMTAVEGDVADLQSEGEEIFLPAQVLSNDPGATNPATWNASMAGSRLSAWLIPTGSTNAFFWSFLPTPEAWSGSGKKVRTTVYYGISVNGAGSDKLYILSSGYGYDSGDLNTSPTTSWNEASNPDISSLVANTMYTQNILEGGATIGSEAMIGVRINFSRANAGYTYTGNTFLFGVKLELV